MMNNLFSFFDKICYINMDKDLDRKIELENLFSKYNIISERIPAIKLSLPESEIITMNGGVQCTRLPERLPYLAAARGTTLSHLNAISLAKYKKLKNVLILEDDVMFSDNILQDLNYCLEDLKKVNWDIFFLGCNPVEKFYQVTDSISKCGGGVYMSHAYAVNHTFYDKLLNFDFSYFWVFDQYLFSLARDTQNNIFMSNKNLVNQKPGFSGAEGHYVDYSLAVEHNYKINFVPL